MDGLSGVELMAYCAGEYHFLARKRLDERPQLITQSEREAFQRGYDASANAFASFVVLAPESEVIKKPFEPVRRDLPADCL